MINGKNIIAQKVWSWFGICCYFICWLYFLVQVVWKDVGRHVSISAETSFLLCTDFMLGKFPVLTDCLADDFIVRYCLAGDFIMRYSFMAG